VCENTRSFTNCNQHLLIELLSVINFHREIEPTNSLQYILPDDDQNNSLKHVIDHLCGIMPM
jgi:hypothetical protein